MDGSQAADQLVSQSLRVTEQVSKLSALGAKHLALILVALFNESKELFTRTGIDKIISKGELPAIVPLNKDELSAFKEQAKKFNLKFLAISDRDSNTADVVLNQNDAGVINRILEKIGYAPQEFVGVQDPNGLASRLSENGLNERESISNPMTMTTPTDKPSVVDKVERLKVSLKVEDKTKGAKDFER